MRGVLTCILLMLFVLSCTAQYFFVKQWDYRYGTVVNEYSEGGIISTPDSGFIIAGTTASGINGDKTQPLWGYVDAWVLKISASGIKQWDKDFGGYGGESFVAINNTLDGGLIFAGSTDSGISGDITEASRGDLDYWIVKTDAMGNKRWVKRFGGSSYDLLTCMQRTSDGGYILGGWSNSNSGGDKTENNWSGGFYYDYWVVKIDSLGTKEWDKTYGGLQDDGLSGIAQMEDGGYVLTGWSKSDSSGNRTLHNIDSTYYLNGAADSWTVRIDKDGNKLWEKRMGRTELGGSVVSTGDSGCMLILESTGVPDGLGGNPWLIKLDNSGNKQWDHSYVAAAYFCSIFKTKDGGYLLSERALRDVIGSYPTRTEECLGKENSWIFKIDSLGNKQWDKTIFTTGKDRDGCVIETMDGCYAVVNTSKAGVGGYKSQTAIDSTYDYWLLKFCMEPFNSIEPTPKSPKGDLNSRIQVWPNPFSTDLSLTLSEGEGIIPAATFTITNTTGQVVYQQQESNLAKGYTKMLDLSYLSNGVYFVEVSTSEGKVVQRVVKE